MQYQASLYGYRLNGDDQKSNLTQMPKPQRQDDADHIGDGDPLLEVQEAAERGHLKSGWPQL